MIRPFHLALVALLLAGAGCTFERRPEADGGAADTPRATEASRATDPGASDARELDEARAFFREFQDARRRGELREVRSRLHPSVYLFLGSRRLSGDDAGPGVRALLSTPDGEGAAPARVEEIGLLGPGVVLVVAYPGSDAVASQAVETLLLVPDTAGWSVRLLQRGVEPPE